MKIKGCLATAAVPHSIVNLHGGFAAFLDSLARCPLAGSVLDLDALSAQGRAICNIVAR